MTNFKVLLYLLFLSHSLLGQVRVSKLVIKSHEAYTLSETDILVADTLIMMDSSRLILNKLKPDNFIRTKVVIVGSYCVIDGKGLPGNPGRQGRHGLSYNSPCRDGLPGGPGSRGLDGRPGINLSFYFSHITVRGPWIIDVSGGDGGQGGPGGSGGGGSPGTLHCNGGNGANGGDGAPGGNGARGGNLLLSGPKSQTVINWIGTKILVRTSGGNPGEGGRAGYHGGAGLGPRGKNGKNGEPGTEGKSGTSGVDGSLKFESN
jgi:hypothetical protein